MCPQSLPMLPQKINSLPLTACVVGDNAHTCTERLLTPFEGTKKKDFSKDCHNNHLSQCRIRIECAFGRLVGKWCIFRWPLQASLEDAAGIMCRAAGLHSHCTDNGDTFPVSNNVRKKNASPFFESISPSRCARCFLQVAGLLCARCRVALSKVQCRNLQGAGLG